MWMPRLIVLPLLVTAAACTASPAPRDVEPAAEAASPAAVQAAAQAATELSGQNLVAAMTERCRATVAGQPNASVPAVTRAAQMRDDWVQVDGIVEWGEPGDVARHAWTCDMFRDEAGAWHRRYLSYGPVT